MHLKSSIDHLLLVMQICSIQNKQKNIDGLLLFVCVFNVSQRQLFPVTG